VSSPIRSPIQGRATPVASLVVHGLWSVLGGAHATARRWVQPLSCHGVAGGITYNPMVVDVEADRRADRLFHALADATRRDILKRAIAGEHSVSALARSYPMSFAAVQKHVAVLERAELVTKQRQGREQLVRSNIDTIRTVHRLLDELEAIWRRRIERMDDLLAHPNEGATS
jgi:DNA-binding transcriptional ArsR family regulator